MKAFYLDLTESLILSLALCLDLVENFGKKIPKYFYLVKQFIRSDAELLTSLSIWVKYPILSESKPKIYCQPLLHAVESMGNSIKKNISPQTQIYVSPYWIYLTKYTCVAEDKDLDDASAFSKFRKWFPLTLKEQDYFFWVSLPYPLCIIKASFILTLNVMMSSVSFLMRRSIHLIKDHIWILNLRCES